LKSSVFIDDDKRSFEGWAALIFGWTQEPIPWSANLIYFFLVWPILDNRSFFRKPFFRALLIVLAISGMILAAFTFEVWKLSFDTGGTRRPVTLATGAYFWVISLALIFLYTIGKNLAPIRNNYKKANFMPKMLFIIYCLLPIICFAFDPAVTKKKDKLLNAGKSNKEICFTEEKAAEHLRSFFKSVGKGEAYSENSKLLYNKCWKRAYTLPADEILYLYKEPFKENCL
jgi:hypothetical protein